MSRKLSLRLAVVLALGLILTGPIRAAGFETPSVGKAPQVVEAVLSWLHELWSASDAGCNIDPDGKPRCTPVPVQTNLGCNIDPNGKPYCTP